MIEPRFLAATFERGNTKRSSGQCIMPGGRTGCLCGCPTWRSNPFTEIHFTTAIQARRIPAESVLDSVLEECNRRGRTDEGIPFVITERSVLREVETVC